MKITKTVEGKSLTIVDRLVIITDDGEPVEHDFEFEVTPDLLRHWAEKLDLELVVEEVPTAIIDIDDTIDPLYTGLFVGPGDVLDTRSPADRAAETDHIPGFIDDRCHTCDHNSEYHSAGSGKCLSCPAQRRCAAFDPKATGDL